MISAGCRVIPEILLQTMKQSKAKPENALSAKQLPTLVEFKSKSVEYKIEWRDKAKIQISHISAATKLSTMELEEFCKNTFEDWHDQEGLKIKFSENDDTVKNIMALATINEYENISQENKIKPREKAENIFVVVKFTDPNGQTRVGLYDSGTSEMICLENLLTNQQPAQLI